MRATSREAPAIRYLGVTRDVLHDLAKFSETYGKFGYCSCMRWRMRSTDYQRSSKEARAKKLKQMVNDGLPVGVLAYAGNEPIGWCSIAPRESCEALERYKKLSRID
jgi:hypothetical protein